MEAQPAQYAESLNRAQHGESLKNYDAIYNGFTAKGIALSDIRPRENVYTYSAWKALGRYVRKGETGVKISSWIPVSKKMENGETAHFTQPRSTTVFHRSQTEEAGK
jgi:hypothetical protein